MRKFSHLRKFAGLRRTFSSVGLAGSFGSQYPPGFCSSRISLAQPLRGIFEYASLTSGSFSLRSEEHTSELQSQSNLVCRLLLEKKKQASQNAPQCDRRQSPVD